MLIYGNLNLNNGKLLNACLNPVDSSSTAAAAYASTQDIQGMIFYDQTSESFQEAYLDEEEDKWKVKALSNPDSKEAGSTVGHVLTSFTQGVNGALASFSGAAVGTLNTENERGTILTGKTSINAELKALEDAIIASAPSATYTITKEATATEGYISTYKLYKTIDGTPTAIGDAINIPKDFLVKSAEVKTCTEADVPISGLEVGDQYIDFTINAKSGESASEATHLYIAVKSFVTIYTAGNGISIDDNAISVKIASKTGQSLTVSSSGLDISYASKAAAGVINSLDWLKIQSTQVYNNVTNFETITDGMKVFLPIEEYSYALKWNYVAAFCTGDNYEIMIPSSCYPAASLGITGAEVVFKGMTSAPSINTIVLVGRKVTNI